jgi:uncharacterized protein YgbK (DUF1537 family)
LKSISHDILIVADDLTGACDAAVPFASVGSAVAARVYACSTESRDLDEAAMIASMERIARAAPRARLIFKKIDSVLRGNVQAEIDAASKTFACVSAVITPAFPQMGRTVRNGYLHVDGVPFRQVDQSYLEADTDQDLDEIVAAGLKREGCVLWAGSAGLAKALARKLYGEPQPVEAPAIDGQIAFCIGSDHSATQQQLQELNRLRPNARIVPIRRGQTTARHIRNELAGAAALFITGGDTASSVLQAVGARSIVLKHEALTGVPWGMLSGGIFDGCPVVTKSGGFGAPDTLVKVADFFPCRI